MKDADGHIFTSFIRSYTDERTGQVCPSHIADFFVYRDNVVNNDKLFALSSDPNQRGFKFYVGEIFSDAIRVEPELTRFTRTVRNVDQHYDAILAAYRDWLVKNPWS